MVVVLLAVSDMPNLVRVLMESAVFLFFVTVDINHMTLYSVSSAVRNVSPEIIAWIQF